MLWLGLVTRDTGIPASTRLQIRDEVVALDFDLAVSLRLFRFDAEKRQADHKFLTRLIVGGDDGDEVLGSEFIGGDKYADGDTQVW